MTMKERLDAKQVLVAMMDCKVGDNYTFNWLRYKVVAEEPSCEGYGWIELVPSG